MFELIMIDQENKRRSIFYDPHKSTVSDKDGKDILITDVKPHSCFKKAIGISPTNPGSKVSKLSKIRIQLGLGCNYSCSYCLQKDQIKDSTKTSLRDAEIFMKNLDKWVEGAPAEIEFWGGEPLLYWNKIKFLLEKLTERFPEVSYLIITNGSLIDDDFIETVEKYNIRVAISHDGPGQYNRGPDPLDNPIQFEMIKKFFDRRKNNMSFNSVITPSNMNLDKIEQFFKSKFGQEARISFEGVVINYDDGESNTFTTEQYNELSKNVAMSCMRPFENLPNTFQIKIREFMKTLQNKLSSDSVFQKCGMDREDYIAVDLLGNVMTCQNTGSTGKHRIGHVYSLDKVKLNTSWHWSQREECSHCPVLQLCAGSCMYVEGPSWYHSCNNEYYYNMGILAGAMYHMTGMILEEVKGETWRPDPADYGVTIKDHSQNIVDGLLEV